MLISLLLQSWTAERVNGIGYLCREHVVTINCANFTTFDLKKKKPCKNLEVLEFLLLFPKVDLWKI